MFKRNTVRRFIDTQVFLEWTVAVFLFVSSLGSCHDDHVCDTSSRSGVIPIDLVVADEATRARLQNTLIQANETVYIWTKYSASNTSYFDAWTTASNGAMRLLPVYGPHYYPADGSAIDFLGIHGDFHINENDPLVDTLWHTVRPSQIAPIDYYRSDLLRSTKNNMTAPDTVRMLFYHKLSRIEVCLQAVGSITDADLVGARVFIVRARPTAKLATKTGVVYAEGALSEVEIPLSTIPAAAPSFSGANFEGAVIPPQTITKAVLRVHLADGRDFYCPAPSGGMIYLEGKAYTYAINMKHLITFFPIVEDWYDDEIAKRWAIMIFDPVVEDWIPVVIAKYDGPMDFFPVVEDWENDSIMKNFASMEFYPVVEDWERDSIIKSYSGMEFYPVVEDWLALTIGSQFATAMTFSPVVEDWLQAIITKFTGGTLFEPVVEDWDAEEIPLSYGIKYQPMIESWDSTTLQKNHGP